MPHGLKNSPKMMMSWVTSDFSSVNPKQSRSKVEYRQSHDPEMISAVGLNS
jgi:hypothetical protein